MRNKVQISLNFSCFRLGLQAGLRQVLTIKIAVTCQKHASEFLSGMSARKVETRHVTSPGLHVILVTGPLKMTTQLFLGLLHGELRAISE